MTDKLTREELAHELYQAWEEDDKLPAEVTPALWLAIADKAISLTGYQPAPAPPPEPRSTVHACPVGDSGETECCGKSPFELPRSDRLTAHSGDVTCADWRGSERSPPSEPERPRMLELMKQAGRAEGELERVRAEIAELLVDDCGEDGDLVRSEDVHEVLEASVKRYPIIAEVIEPPEPERPEFWNWELERNGSFILAVGAGRHFNYRDEVIDGLLASHNARRAAEARVAVLEYNVRELTSLSERHFAAREVAEKRVAELQAELQAELAAIRAGDDFFAVTKARAAEAELNRLRHEPCYSRALAAEAELRRLREEVKEWYAGYHPTGCGAILSDSEARYPLPAEEEHRGGRK